jgi:phosphoglycolate phosphatase
LVETGATSDSTVVVGDTTFDMEMALNARAKAVGVTWGYHPRTALSACGAHALIESYSELPAIIDRLLTTAEAAQ